MKVLESTFEVLAHTLQPRIGCKSHSKGSFQFQIYFSVRHFSHGNSLLILHQNNYPKFINSRNIDHCKAICSTQLSLDILQRPCLVSLGSFFFSHLFFLFCFFLFLKLKAWQTSIWHQIENRNRRARAPNGSQLVRLGLSSDLTAACSSSSN